MYVASSVAATTSGVQPANVYVYSAVASFVGTTSVAGTLPSTTSTVSSVSPSQFLNVIVYLTISVAVYVAVYVASPVTATISASQPANVYVNSSSASLVGSAGAVGIAPYSTSVF